MPTDVLEYYSPLEVLVARRNVEERVGREPTTREILDEIYQRGLAEILAKQAKRRMW